MEPERLKLLIKRISRREESAFKELFDLYYPKLIQIALAYVPGIVAAQEMVSDVFYKLLKNPHNLLKVSNLDNYLFLSVRNQSFTYLKRNRKRNLTDSLDHKEDYIVVDKRNPESSLISRELHALIRKTINELPPKRKAIFLLVKEEGKKYREVAEIMDISVKTVEVHMSLALKNIRMVVTGYLESKDTKIRKLGSTGVVNSLLIFFF